VVRNTYKFSFLCVLAICCIVSGSTGLIKLGEVEMSIPEVIIPLYHTDTKSLNQKFVSGAFFPSKEDGEWCGAGMYFWDNLSNAHYWEASKRRRARSKDVNVSRSSLKCARNDILDLTSAHNSMQLKIFARYYAEKYNVPVDFSKNGTVINFVHDAYEMDHGSTFSVVRVSGIYGGPHAGVIGDNDRESKRPHATERVKIIYAVREGSLVNDRAIVDPTKEGIPNEFSF